MNENSLLGLNMSKPNAFLLTVGRKAATSSPCMALLKYSFSPLRNQHFPKTCVPGRRSHDENGATGEDSGNANHGNQKRLGVHDNSKNVKVETRPFPRFESKQTGRLFLLNAESQRRNRRRGRRTMKMQKEKMNRLEKEYM